MKIINIALSTLLAAGVSLSFVSCEHETLQKELSTKGKTALSEPTGISYDPEMSSVKVSWNPVENAGQYWYELRNQANYIISGGLTTSTSVNVSGLHHTTTYNFKLKAIPSGTVAKDYCSSEISETEVSTKAKKIWKYEWSRPAVSFFVNNRYYTNTVFGKEAGTDKYVLESYSSIDGFDLVLTINAQGKYQVDPTSDTYIGKFGWETRVYHGVGGAQYPYISIDEQYNSSAEGNTSTGGSIFLSCYSPSYEWGWFNIYYGDQIPQ